MKMDSNKMGRPRINVKEKSKELTEKSPYDKLIYTKYFK